MPAKKTKEIDASSEVTKKITPLPKYYKIAAIVAVVLIALGFLFKSMFIAATVNGSPISRLSIIKELESRGGKQALDAKITNILILQEAKKRQVTIGDKQVEDQIKKIMTNLGVKDKEFDELLAAQGLTKEILNGQVRLELIVTELLGKEIAISDSEIDEYIKTNKDSLPKETPPEKIRSEVSEQLKQKKMGEQAQKLLEKLKKDAKITYFVNYK